MYVVTLNMVADPGGESLPVLGSAVQGAFQESVRLENRVEHFHIRVDQGNRVTATFFLLAPSQEHADKTVYELCARVLARAPAFKGWRLVRN